MEVVIESQFKATILLFRKKLRPLEERLKFFMTKHPALIRVLAPENEGFKTLCLIKAPEDQKQLQRWVLMRKKLPWEYRGLKIERPIKTDVIAAMICSNTIGLGPKPCMKRLSS